ncbi:helix-turn-helix transcriptional regulator [Enterobacter hormaechei]|uniref:helix-turn-helix transcriptional regulator n=1 Tax=Enterobacter hormaechei TaxID=158836 RepID=UPI00403AD610
MDKLLTFDEVINRTGYSRPRIYELIKLGVFPRKIKIGSRKVAFIESEINSWIQGKISTSTKQMAKKNKLSFWQRGAFVRK